MNIYFFFALFGWIVFKYKHSYSNVINLFGYLLNCQYLTASIIDKPTQGDHFSMPWQWACLSVWHSCFNWIPCPYCYFVWIIFVRTVTIVRAIWEDRATSKFSLIVIMMVQKLIYIVKDTCLDSLVKARENLYYNTWFGQMSNTSRIFQEELLTSCIPKDLMNDMKKDLMQKMTSKVPRITPFHDLYVKHHSNVR